MAPRAGKAEGCLLLMLLLLTACALTAHADHQTGQRDEGHGVFDYRHYILRTSGFSGHEPKPRHSHPSPIHYGPFDPYSDPVYTHFDPSQLVCKVLEGRFEQKCVDLAKDLDENDCQQYCGSVEGQECKAASESCSETSGLCGYGEKCCSTPPPESPTPPPSLEPAAEECPSGGLGMCLVTCNDMFSLPRTEFTCPDGEMCCFDDCKYHQALKRTIIRVKAVT